MQASARLSSSAASKRVIAGISSTITRSCYRTSRGKAHAAPLSAQEPPPKGQKRVSKQERRARIEEFVEKYKIANEGKFPSIKNVRQHVGGGHYTVREILQEMEYNQTKQPLDNAKAPQAQERAEFAEHSSPKDGNGENSYNFQTFKSNQNVDDVVISLEGTTTNAGIVGKTETCSFVGSHYVVETEAANKDLHTTETSKKSNGPTLSGETEKKNIKVPTNEPFISSGMEAKSDPGSQQGETKTNILNLSSTANPLISNETTASDQSASEKVIKESFLDRENDPKLEHEQSSEEPKKTGLLGSLKSFADGIRSFWKKL
ncbi:hypothetical protein ACP70R_026575 [Stipagrostis hirtigluma subsp. patula]